MTSYTVHLNREVRLTFEGIEADSPEEAAALACDENPAAYDDIDSCDGEAFVAEVHDGDSGQSVSIDFEPERQRTAFPKILAALEETLSLLDGCMRNANRLGQPEFAARIGTMISVNRAVIAEATAGRDGGRP